MRFRFTGALLLTMTFTLFLGGCGQDSSSSPTDNQNQVDHPSSITEPELAPWQIYYKTDCPSEVPRDQCSGGYGFTLNSDGFYEVGPGPDGQRFRGVLDEDQMKNFTNIMREEVLDDRAPQHCGKNDDSVQVTYNDQKSHSCHYRIKTEMKKLVDEYYPEKFPNPCVDATAELEKLYDSAVRCENDDDCSFLGSDYLPLGPYGFDGKSVEVDDCSYIEPLAIANTFKAVSLQRDLLKARTYAREVCGEDSMRPSCKKTYSISPSKKNQFCFKHQCQLRTLR